MYGHTYSRVWRPPVFAGLRPTHTAKPAYPNDSKVGIDNKHPSYHDRVMGYKTTTDPFVLRGSTNLTVTGDSGSDTNAIDTSLDTLNREVLLVWEVDIQSGKPSVVLDELIGFATINTLNFHDSVQTASGVVSLSDADYVAGKNTTYIGGNKGATNVFAIQEERNPDSREFSSRDRIPLAIITDSTIIVRSGFDVSSTLTATGVYQSHFRIMAQRAKADADTYAALVTGLL